MGVYQKSIAGHPKPCIMGVQGEPPPCLPEGAPGGPPEACHPNSIVVFFVTFFKLVDGFFLDIDGFPEDAYHSGGDFA